MMGMMGKSMGKEGLGGEGGRGAWGQVVPLNMFGFNTKCNSSNYIWLDVEIFFHHSAQTCIDSRYDTTI